MKSVFGLVLAAALAAPAAAFTIDFQNNCGYTVWPAVGKAPYGSPDPSVAFGTTLGPGGSASFNVADSEIGIRAWGRTGCDSNGANCATGACNGGLVCTDAGITSGVILSEYGYANFGQYGGDRISWDLSIVDSSINLNTRLSTSDGQTVYCANGNCPDDQAYTSSTDYAADRNSPLGTTFTHTFCA
ncbi:Osmotin thaumatin-like protein [Coniophora puteana RWD-64-598 SS2]|uniref:Osmotin thaumatin-like protein n=1 Tax=Coniophora puteana (strain RWD-64-598) TaxID=741705 RepID=A0A5M3MVV6_CONPW|nr:Osmotin thaumatin-like protein [Coniophora puteana RWD-64-598 SS2]EIW82854.1 Osmotin thaumatin-like protein [Coniophora puteana RWD-64-598 SS2]